MAFFKSTRDQLKANALVSHLEFALNRWEHSPTLGLRHLRSAVKALVEVKNAGAEQALTFIGWKYVVHISTQVGMIVATAGPEDALADCKFIVDQAIKWRDEAWERESTG